MMKGFTDWKRTMKISSAAASTLTPNLRKLRLHSNNAAYLHLVVHQYRDREKITAFGKSVAPAPCRRFRGRPALGPRKNWKN